MEKLKDRKILQMGLGILGGGVATARWLVEQGAILTVNDIKNEAELSVSLEKLKDVKSRINFIFGKHEERDFLENEIIVINPDIPKNNHYVNFAIANNKKIENELTLYLKYEAPKKVIAVTGTRGKTTTTNWINHFWKAKIPDAKIKGNSPTAALLSEKDANDEAVVLECPSFLLEQFEDFAPNISIITNIFVDHLNRYKNIEDYVETKAKIFKYQDKNDVLILNHDSNWTDFILNLKPKSRLYFFSKKPLPEDVDGIYLDEIREVILKKDGIRKKVIDSKEFVTVWGEHNLENLMTSILAADLIGVGIEKISQSIATLPVVKMRQEVVFQSKDLTIVNDSSSTSPEANLAAVRRFNKNDDTIVILGGTDKELDFGDWAENIKKEINKDNLIFLEGTATEKMLEKLDFRRGDIKIFPSLEKCLLQAKKMIGVSVSKIVFSPGAKSFGIFKNELERGEVFDELVKKYYA